MHCHAWRCLEAWFKDPASSTGLSSSLIKLLSSGLMPAIGDPANSKNSSPPLPVFTSSPLPSLHYRGIFSETMLNLKIVRNEWRFFNWFFLYLYKLVLFSKYLSSSVELFYWIFSKTIQSKVDRWRNFHINSLCLQHYKSLNIRKFSMPDSPIVLPDL